MLWCEQIGDTWREPKPLFTWPVLAADDERWEVHSAIDAIVADAYGLIRDQYAHVLSTFSHRSYLKAPALCLARFDELKQVGLDAFTKKYDPYWDIPLNEEPPKPVIDLPISTEEGEKQSSGQWQEHGGQMTFLSPGPLFDKATPQPMRRSAQRAHRSRSAK